MSASTTRVSESFPTRVVVLTVVIATGLLTASFVAAQGALLWQQSIDGTLPAFRSIGDAAQSLAVTSQGDVIAAGRTINAVSDQDFTVVKLDRNGVLLWQHDLDGNANGLDSASAVALTPEGDVVATGYMSDAGRQPHLAVVKFDSDGAVLWQRTLGVGAGNSVAITPNGDVVAAGWTNNG